MLFVMGLLIEGGIAGKPEAAGAGAELMAVGLNFHADAVIDGVCHLGSQEAAPNQAIKAILLAGEAALDALGGQLHAGRADCLMGVLRPGLGAEAAGGRGIIL